MEQNCDHIWRDLYTERHCALCGLREYAFDVPAEFMLDQTGTCPKDAIGEHPHGVNCEDDCSSFGDQAKKCWRLFFEGKIVR